MFDSYCPECEKRQLIFPAQVDRIINDDAGIVAIFSCWCGAKGAERLRSAKPVVSSPTPAHALAS
jgi:hypothetical protein